MSEKYWGLPEFKSNTEEFFEGVADTLTSFFSLFRRGRDEQVIRSSQELVRGCIEAPSCEQIMTQFNKEIKKARRKGLRSFCIPIDDRVTTTYENFYCTHHRQYGYKRVWVTGKANPALEDKGIDYFILTW